MGNIGKCSFFSKTHAESDQDILLSTRKSHQEFGIDLSLYDLMKNIHTFYCLSVTTLRINYIKKFIAISQQTFLTRKLHFILL